MFRAELWIFTTLYACGVIAGMGYLMLSPADDQPAQSVQSRQKEIIPVTTAVNDITDVQSLVSELGDQTARDVVEAIKQGDRSLLTGNFQAATVRYQKANKFSPQSSIPLMIRLAICAEQTSNFLLAERLYDKVQTLTNNRNHQMIAQLGSARVWQELNKSDDALRFLADHFLQSHTRNSLPIELQAQLLYELANLIQDNALQNYHRDITQPDGLVFHRAPPDLTLLIQLLDAADDAEQSAEIAIPDDQILLVQRPASLVGVILLSANKNTSPIRNLLAELGDVGRFEIRLSADAGEKLTARSKKIHFQNMPLSLVLDGLLTPLGLYWTQDQDVVNIYTLDELPDDLNRQMIAISVAERMFRQFSISFPGDYRSNSVGLSRGNLHLLNGNFESAGTYYEVVAQASPTAELRAKLAFDQGKLSIMLGRDKAAIEQLYLAVDQTYDPKIKSVGYWLIGQLYLEADDMENSIYAAGRALSTARHTKQKQLAALTLARAYLFKNDPASANQVLFNNRNEFKNSVLGPAISVLINYSQFIGVEDEKSKNVAEQRLMYALAGIPNQLFSSFFDLYLAGRAYQALGVPEKAIERLGHAATMTEIPVWKNRILLSLAVEKRKVGQEKDAAKIFKFLMEQTNDEIGRTARIQLADLYLNNDMPEKCLVICQNLMALELSEAERNRMLSLMGFAYRQLKQHHSSALCFAGIFPPEEPNPADQVTSQLD